MAEAPAPAPAPAPTEKVSVSFYGWVVGNMYYSNSKFAAMDHPGQPTQTNTGGGILFSARASRLGLKLDVDGRNFTGSKLTGNLEFDFAAGQLPNQVSAPSCTSTGGTYDPTTGAAVTQPTITCAAPSVGTTSTAWYNGIMRMRLASLTSKWTIPTGSVALLVGQDWGLVNPVSAESLAYLANPLFSQSGQVWRRSPQFRLTYAGNFGMVAVNVAAAVLNPADASPSVSSAVPSAAAATGTGVSTAGSQTAPVDFGAGNQSKTPDIEGRVGVTVNPTKTITGTIGAGFNMGKRKYGVIADTAAKQALWAPRIDVSTSLFGVDLDVNVPYAQIKGEYYQAKGMDDAYNGMVGRSIGLVVTPAVTTDTTAPASIAATTLRTSGYWGQVIIKPIAEVWVTAGYGSESANEDDLKAAPGVFAAGTRQKNTTMAFGLFGNFGKYWRAGVEWAHTETIYVKTNAATAATGGPAATPSYVLDDPRKGDQFTLSSQLKF